MASWEDTFTEQFEAGIFMDLDQHGIVRGKWLVANNALSPSDDMLKVAREMAGKQ
jgi:hypothetical protein